VHESYGGHCICVSYVEGYIYTSALYHKINIGLLGYLSNAIKSINKEEVILISGPTACSVDDYNNKSRVKAWMICICFTVVHR
jgi:hypothetical protein